MKKKIGFSLSALFIVSLFISACDDTIITHPPTSTLTQAQSSKAASKAIVGALGTATVSGGAGTNLSKPSSTHSSGTAQKDDSLSIREALTNFKASLAAKRQKPQYAITPVNEVCAGGGTKKITEDGLGFKGVYSACKETEGQIEFYTDGTIEITMNLLTGEFQMKLTNFLERITDLQNKGVTESIENGTIAFKGKEILCGPAGSEESFLENGTITLTNLTSTEKEDKKGDGTFEFNESSAYTSLVVQISETVGLNCAPGTAVLTLNGSETITDNLDASKSYTAVYSGLEVIEAPTTRIVGGNTLSGDAVSINGTLTITACGASATVTIVTDKDPTKAPFVPEREECPVDGKSLVTTGGVTSAIIATSTGGVQIDEGNNGSIDQTFANCEDANVCV